MGMDAPWDGGTCTSDLQCDDDMFCNGVERCTGGHCQRGTPPTCDDGVSCTSDGCVEGAGCVSRPNDALCPPGEVCTPGGCIPNTTRCRTNADCDDHLTCNGVETCDPASGQCFGGAPMFCGDGVACTDDQCIEGFGCAHAANSAECPLGQICNPMIGCQTRTCGASGGCDDGDPCNGIEFCSPDGLCHPGSPLNCNDGNMCTLDFCVTGRGCVSQTQMEICNDGIDDDCNGLIDCADPVCSGRPGCSCVPSAPFERLCGDGIDNDCNGLTDCGDPFCGMDPACRMCIPTEPFERSCRDGVDNDCNGRIDCFDPNCIGTFQCPGDAGFCMPRAPVEVICLDGIDDDCDGFIDCADPDCFGRPGCGVFPDGGGGPDVGVCTFPENCHNGIDDDCNGLTDCMDFFCVMTDPSCRTCVPTSMFERNCFDGIDDDCDGLIDCADRDCRMRRACIDAGPPDGGFQPDAIVLHDAGGPVTNEIGVAMCTNGIDDDRDGRADCADPDCRPFGPTAECCNGIDDTGDGNIDEFTCRCFDQSFCGSVGSLSQVCWLNSYSVCAPRCNFYGGNSFCQMNLPATPTCNATTGECQ